MNQTTDIQNQTVSLPRVFCCIPQPSTREGQLNQRFQQQQQQQQQQRFFTHFTPFQQQIPHPSQEGKPDWASAMRIQQQPQQSASLQQQAAASAQQQPYIDPDSQRVPYYESLLQARFGEALMKNAPPFKNNDKQTATELKTETVKEEAAAITTATVGMASPKHEAKETADVEKRQNEGINSNTTSFSSPTAPQVSDNQLNVAAMTAEAESQLNDKAQVSSSSEAVQTCPNVKTAEQLNEEEHRKKDYNRFSSRVSMFTMPHFVVLPLELRSYAALYYNGAYPYCDPRQLRSPQLQMLDRQQRGLPRHGPRRNTESTRGLPRGALYTSADGMFVHSPAHRLLLQQAQQLQQTTTTPSQYGAQFFNQTPPQALLTIQPEQQQQHQLLL